MPLIRCKFPTNSEQLREPAPQKLENVLQRMETISLKMETALREKETNPQKREFIPHKREPIPHKGKPIPQTGESIPDEGQSFIQKMEPTSIPKDVPGHEMETGKKTGSGKKGKHTSKKEPKKGVCPLDEGLTNAPVKTVNPALVGEGTVNPVEIADDIEPFPIEVAKIETVTGKRTDCEREAVSDMESELIPDTANGRQKPTLRRQSATNQVIFRVWS